MTKEPTDSNPKNDLNVKKSKKRDIKEVEEQPGKKEKLYGTRKHPKEVAAIKRQPNSGLRNPLKLETDETVFSSSSFSDLKISDKLVEVLKSPNVFNFSRPTVVQSQTIPIISKGGDVMIKSATGSGKTLSYLIPIVQRLQSFPTKIDRSDGAYVIILVPTRELCVQIEETLKKLLLPFFWIVPTVICGGQKRKSEKSRIRKGANIIISTPGRLLDHALHTTSLSLQRVQMLVLDEADRLLDMGFEQQLRDLFSLLHKQITQPLQTLLLSATLSPAIQQLAELSLHNPTFIDSDSLTKEQASPSGAGAATGAATGAASAGSSTDATEEKFKVPKQLRQYFIQIDASLRLPALCAFIRKELRDENQRHCRILIFVNTCDSVAFHDELFRELSWPGDGIDTSVVKGSLVSLHGNMPQHQRLKNLRDFCKANFATMICTDVAARGLDIPVVDWVIQYDPPTEISEYIHRVGRTARAGKSGQSLLFLQPSEMGMVFTLQSKGLNMRQFNFDIWFDNCVRKSGPGHKLVYAKRNHAASEIQASILRSVDESEGLNDLAVMGFMSYCRAYATYSKELKGAFNVRLLHFGHIAKSFGLHETPKKLGKISVKKFNKKSVELASAKGEGSAKLDFGHTSEKKQLVFDAIKKAKEIKEKRTKRKEQQGDYLRGKMKVQKLMNVSEFE